MTSKPDFKVMVLLLVFMQLTRDLFAIAKFLFNVRQKTDARYSYRLDVCPSVRLSVCLSVCHAGIVSNKLSSLPGRPMILVLRGLNFPRNSNGNTPMGALNARG